MNLFADGHKMASQVPKRETVSAQTPERSLTGTETATTDHN